MLELTGLRRSFGDRVAVDDVTFAVPRGSIVGFVGANGAGKTTTMRIVLGLFAPDGGDVRWDGAPVDRDVRGRFGSLGNQQRVQLAAALVHERDALVLDEPFPGLDPLAVDTMSDVLRERAAAGAVAELRDAGARGCWRVRVEGAPPGWTPALPGAEVVGREAADTVVALADGVDEQALLDAARADGRVTAFGPARRTLSDVFCSVVEEAA